MRVMLTADDQCYGMIKWKQAGMGLQDFGLTLRNPDFVKLAEVPSLTNSCSSSVTALSTPCNIPPASLCRHARKRQRHGTSSRPVGCRPTAHRATGLRQ